ncbi:hypothetical protein ONS96_013285 [Cadophora gregata f. sp. sojae]|nr:hypothetical protein ONS96_013285 [Cadophora gregata f. sp. sojae]
MESTSFTPYWRQVGLSMNPYSFVFFVVAQIGGRRRPIAVVSSRAAATEPAEEFMQGTPLITACQRLITIFSDNANHSAIGAELSLAESYYLTDAGQKIHRPELCELPENVDGYYELSIELGSWNHDRVQQFPFISACLLQGVAFDAHGGKCYEASPEPLGTVYRDTNVEWAMVVIDITSLQEVRYGIVSFASAPMKWVPSQEALDRQLGPRDFLGAPSSSGGEFRVLDQVRERVAMSAAEYMQKVVEPDVVENDDTALITQLLANVPLVDSNAFDVIWPADSVELEDETVLQMERLSLGKERTLHEHAIKSLLLSTVDVEDFNIHIFDDVRKLPYFPELLRRNLLKDSTRFWNTRSSGLLLRLAFEDGERLNLERVQNISVQAILAAVNVPGMGSVSSLSICTTSIRDLSGSLIEGLSKSKSLREIHFMQSPFREVDTPDTLLLEALSSYSHFLSRVKVLFASSYSAALLKKFWLPSLSTSNTTSQVALLSVYPIQQILIRYQTKKGDLHNTKDFTPTSSIYLGDSLLTPSRFATGFLTYLRTASPWPAGDINPSAQLFAFSSAPSSLSSSTLTSSAEISPIPAESFALGDFSLPQGICPKIRDLHPEGWTVLVSFEHHWDRDVARAANKWAFNPDPEHPEMRPGSPRSDYIRYAFVRARGQTIRVGQAESRALTTDELDVMGLREFLAVKAPEVDPGLVEKRLGEAGEFLARKPTQGVLPLNVEPLSVMGRDEAVSMLGRCLKDAGDLNGKLRNAMKDDPEGGLLKSVHNETEADWYRTRSEMVSRASVEEMAC